MRKGLFYSTAAIGLLALHAPAAAQSTSGGAVSEVVVTGSRLMTNGNQAPTPVTVASSEQLQAASPANLNTGLNQLPQFLGSINNRNQGVQSSSGSSHGNSLALRNLGPLRTLILLDGRRVPPTRFQGTVDTSVLPELLVKRVEVVTGGASAVYGSDAVTGVVNYILDSTFEGLKLNAQGGISTKNDGKSYRVGIAGGTEALDGRAHLVFSAEHSSEDPVWRYKRDRDNNQNGRVVWAARDLNAPNPGTASNPLILRYGAQSSTFSWEGAFTSGPPGVNRTMILGDGSVVPFLTGTPTGAGASLNGSGTASTSSMHAITGLITDQVFGQITYDLTPKIKATANVTYGRASAHVVGSTGVFINIPILSGNAYLPAQTQSILTSTNTRGVTFSKQLNETAGLQQDEASEALIGTLALSGEITEKWRFDVYYTHGDSNYTGKIHQFDNAKLYAATDAVRSPTGQIVCRTTLTAPGLFPGCTPFNPFGIRSESDAALAYIGGIARLNINNKMDVLSASISGEPFSTWAGPVGISVGGEYRKTSLDIKSNSDPANLTLIPRSVLDQLPGVNGLGTLASLTAYSNTNFSTAVGSSTVKEAFGEVNVPLARDLPLAKALDISAAGRRTDYSTSGAVTTWKAGFSYKPFEDLRFRGTISRDIRAPSLFELFASGTLTSAVTFDSHTGFNVNVLTQGGGNPSLVPERGKTKSFGVVYQPNWAPRFSVSVDLFDIKIKGAIAAPSGSTIIQDCENSGGTGASCALITRPLPFSDRTVSNGATRILAVPINTGLLASRGVDVDASYNFDVEQIVSSWPGNLALRAIIGYVGSFKVQADATSPVLELAGVADDRSFASTASSTAAQPKWRGNLTATYRNGGLTVFGQMRYISSMVGGPRFVYEPHIPAYVYFDTTVSYETKVLGRNTEVFLTVNNLFNKNYPLWPNASTAPGTNFPTVVSVYDIMGRYFTAGVRLRF